MNERMRENSKVRVKADILPRLRLLLRTLLKAFIYTPARYPVKFSFNFSPKFSCLPREY